MADTDIYLEIQTNDKVPDPDRGAIPWNIALVTRADMKKDNPRRDGNRPKKKGFYYRFTGGNTKWDNGDPISDGDFEFSPNTGTKTVEIRFNNSPEWTFVEVKELDENGPLRAQVVNDGTLVKIEDDTANIYKVSGNFGVVVKKPGVSLYCDPNWDNR